MPRWTDEEIQYLKDNYADTDGKVLAKQLNRSKDAINIKSNYLGLNKEGAAQKWTEEEVQYLKDNYADVDNETLAEKLNRKVGAINNKAFQFNLRKKVKTQLEIGAKFGRLTILKEVKPFTTTTLSKSGKTYINKHKVYLCVCDCGNEKEIMASVLLKGSTKSCGCLRKEDGSEKIKKALASDNLKKHTEKVLVEGTNLDQLNKKIGINNTSGHKGVGWSRRHEKWRASIGFQGKNIYLGLYADKQDAIKARLQAEEEYFVPILEKYKDVFDNEK